MKIRFTEADADNCGWCFNCGPSALCAALGLTPNEIRPHMLDFESKNYTSPTMMQNILKGLGVGFQTIYRGDTPTTKNVDLPVSATALVRVQWGGPWCNEGVPMRVRYGATHWIAVTNHPTQGLCAYDINAMCDDLERDGTSTYWWWSKILVPWLIPQLKKKADGDWWLTHVHVLDLAGWKGLPK